MSKALQTLTLDGLSKLTLDELLAMTIDPASEGEPRFISAAQCSEPSTVGQSVYGVLAAQRGAFNASGRVGQSIWAYEVGNG